MRNVLIDERNIFMKAVILAGGFGTRLQEETHMRPKPMVEIGGKPILWHIMKIYEKHGIEDFIICCGYKSGYIKDYFANYALHHSDVTFDLANENLNIINKRFENWKVTLVDTGANTMTGGRLLRVRQYLENESEFCFTYGDGLSDVNLTKLIEFHRHNNKLATLTATRPPGRFGALTLSDNEVVAFHEKPAGDGMYVNGGFFVLSPEVFAFIEGDETSWEQGPLQALAEKNQLSAFRHDDFWQPMDTLRDKIYLEEMWNSGEAPWKVW